MHLLASPLWWFGMGGAFIYAGPRLAACLFDGQNPACRKCWTDWAVSMAIGPIAAVAFAESIQPHVAMTLPAVAATLGILANPLAPGAIQVVGDGILERLKAFMRGGKT